MIEGFERLSGSPSNDRGGRFFKIQKGERITLFDVAIKKSKVLPGVGKYKAEIALDKVSRPMKG